MFTLSVSLLSASCCEPKKRKGSIRVGPRLLIGIHGCESDVNVVAPFAGLFSQSDGYADWNSKIPPVKKCTFLKTKFSFNNKTETKLSSGSAEKSMDPWS